MEERLRDVIRYICANYPGELTRTILVKMVYLADVEFYKRFSRQMTEVRYVYDHHGPFSWEIVDTAKELGDIGVLDITQDLSVRNTPKYIYTCLGSPESLALDDRDKGVIDDVLNRFGGLSLQSLLNYVYSTPPFTAYEAGKVIDMSVLGRNSSLNLKEKSIVRSKLDELKEGLGIVMVLQQDRPSDRTAEEQSEIDEIAKGFANQIPRIIED